MPWLHGTVHVWLWLFYITSHQVLHSSQVPFLAKSVDKVRNEALGRPVYRHQPQSTALVHLALTRPRLLAAHPVTKDDPQTLSIRGASSIVTGLSA